MSVTIQTEWRVTMTIEGVSDSTARPYAELAQSVVELMREINASEKRLLRQTAELRRVYRMPEVP